MSKANTMMRLVPAPLSKLNNFTSIQILNPAPSLWFDISLVDSLKLRVVSGNHAYLRTLDDAPNARSIAFTRGFFKPMSLDYDLDRPMSQTDHVSQKFVVENASVGIVSNDDPAQRVSKIFSTFKDYIHNFLKEEYSQRVPFPLLDIGAALDKNNDLQISFNFAPKPENKPAFFNAFQYIPIHAITLTMIDLFSPLDQSTVNSIKPSLLASSFDYAPIILNPAKSGYRVVRKSDEFMIKALHDLGVPFLRFQIIEE